MTRGVIVAAPAGIGAGKVQRVRSGIQLEPLRLTVTVALPSVIFATGTVPLRMTVPFS